MDTLTVPDLPTGRQDYNCLVAVDDDTLVAIDSSYDSRSVHRFTVGNSEWEALNTTAKHRGGSGCGLVSRYYIHSYIQFS